MIRGVTVADGPPSPAKFCERPNDALWKSLMFRARPSAPRYNPVNGLMHDAVQLKSGFAICGPFGLLGSTGTVRDGNARNVRLSLALFKMNSA